MMTAQEIDKISVQNYSEIEWKLLIDFFWNRYNKRYFNQIKALQNHSDFEIRNNCGFLMTTIDCILIETLEQYYSGSDESDGKKLHDPFHKFFERVGIFKDVIKDDGDSGKFAGLIRSGLLHQSKTKKDSIINKQSNTPVLDWIDLNNKNKGFKIQRDKFHTIVYQQYEKLIDEIKRPDRVDRRTKFKSKLKTLVE